MHRRSVGELVVSVLPELYALRSIEQFPASALSLVRRVVGGDKGDYTEVDVRSGDFRVFVDPEPPQLRDLGAARAAYMHQHPVLAHFFNGGAPNARLISDFCTRREFHRLGLYGEFFGQLGVEDQLTVVVSPLSSGCGIGVSIDRDRRNFDDRDRRLMDALQPHLTVARDNAVRFSHALSRRTRSDEPPDAAALERVTDRQREILAQLAAGATNAQIALALDISTGTVRKHVEHILRRLGLSTRTAAAVWYITASTAPEASPWTASLPALVTDGGPAGGGRRTTSGDSGDVGRAA